MCVCVSDSTDPEDLEPLRNTNAVYEDGSGNRYEHDTVLDTLSSLITVYEQATGANLLPVAPALPHLGSCMQPPGDWIECSAVGASCCIQKVALSHM